MPGPYVQGNIIRLRAVWTDPTNGNVPIDPGTATIEYADPKGNITTVTFPAGGMVKESVGIYHLDIPVNISGSWWYDAISTGVATARAESNFLVTPTHIQP